MKAMPAASATEISIIKAGFRPFLLLLEPDVFWFAGEPWDSLRQGFCRGNPHKEGLFRNAVGPWFANDPIWGISPLKLLFRRSKLTVTGKFPIDLGILPEKWLKERLRVPDSDFSSPISPGIDPLRSFDDKSSWTKFSISVHIPVGIWPVSRFLARTSLCNCRQFRKSLGIGPESELLDRSRFWRRGRWQMEGGRFPERLLP